MDRNSGGTDRLPRTLSATIDGTAIQYLHYRGDGPTLFLLHATGFLPWLWHPVARALCGNYDIVAPYFCDHRTGEPEEGGVNWRVLAGDVARLAESLGVESLYIAGHSMGATVSALAIALFGLPAVGAVFIEPIFLPEQIYGAITRVDQHPLASRSIKRRDHWHSAAEAEEYLLSKSLFRRWDPEVLRLYIEHGMTGDGGGLALVCSPRREAALFMGSSAENPWPHLSAITCPALVIEGELSENRAYIDLEKAASLMPLGRYQQLPGAGHLIPMERPGETSNIISEFLGPCL